jgi:hypothetical protein
MPCTCTNTEQCDFCAEADRDDNDWAPGEWEAEMQAQLIADNGGPLPTNDNIDAGPSGMELDEITKLRVSVARVAQAIGVNGSDGPCPFRITTDLSYGDLVRLAEQQERGWNELCRQIVERASYLQQE